MATKGKNISTLSTKAIQKAIGVTSDGSFGANTTAAVKAFQRANGLVADGVVGRNTAAVIRAGGGGGVSSSRGNSLSNSSSNAISSSTPIRKTQGTSYRSSSSSKKPSVLGNPFAGGFFKNLSQGFNSFISKPVKDAISTAGENSQGASVLNARKLPDANTNVYNDQTKYSNLDLLLSGGMSAKTFSGEAIKDVGNKIKEILPMRASTTSAAEPYEPNLQTMDLTLGAGETPLNPDLTGEGGLYTTTTASKTEAPDATVTPDGAVAPDPVVTTETALRMEASPSSGTNANILNNINGLNVGLKNDLNGNDAFMSSNSKGEFQQTKIVNYANNVASQFDTQEQAVAFYKTPEGINSLPQGVKPEDIIAKVKQVTNGIVGQQTTPEYLTKLGQGPTALAGEKKVIEQQMQMVANHATDFEKLVLSQAEKDKQEAKTIIEATREKALSKENTVRERLKLANDELRAQQQSDLAEVEINRVNSKANLTEFLAKIGALRTDGGAITGLEKLEQKYQQLKLTTKNSYDFAVRKNEINATDKINELDDAMDARIIEINSDLSKSEREISLDVMKLRFDTKMKGLDYISKFQDSIKIENEKARVRSEKTTTDWTNAYLTIAGADMFKSLESEFRNTWLQNNPISEKGFKTTQLDLAKDYANWSKNRATTKDALSQSDFTKIYSKMQNDKKTSQSDLERFKTDPEFQLYMYSRFDN